MRSFGRGVIVAALMLAAAPASAGPDAKKAKAEAKAHLDKAAAASKEGRDEDALKELDAAYAIDPQPNVLFARGQLNAKLARCEDAIKLLQEFVATNPAQELADMATQGIDACKAALAPPPPPPPPPPADPVPTKVTEAELEEDKENPTLEHRKVAAPKPAPEESTSRVDAPAGPRRWYKDPILIGLGVGALGTVVGGVAFYTAANGYLDESEAAGDYDVWRLYVEDAHRARRYAVLCTAGAAVLIGATVLYYVERYTGDDAPAVTVAPADHGAVVGWTGRF